MAKKIHHYPRLDTVLMVEEALKKARGKGKMQIWRSLPKKIMYQTFLLVLDYLEKSGKIKIEKSRIMWIHDPEFIKRLSELSEYTYNSISESGQQGVYTP